MMEEVWRGAGRSGRSEARPARIRSEWRAVEAVRVHPVAATVHDVAKLLAVIQIHARELARGSIAPERLLAVAGDLSALSTDALALLEDCAMAMRWRSTRTEPGGTLEAVFEQVSETVRRLHPEGVLELESRGLELMMGRPRELAATLVNLVDNGLQASMPGQPVRIEASRERDDAGAEWLRIAVQDLGCGMSEAVRARATEPYFTTRPGGLGLGLASARARAESLGGGLELESQPGVGTRVTVRLPIES